MWYICVFLLHLYTAVFCLIDFCIALYNCSTARNRFEVTSRYSYVGYWRDLSGSGIYQSRAAFNNHRHDLNSSKSKINFCELSWIIVLSFYGLSFQLLCVSSHQAQRSISGSGQNFARPSFLHLGRRSNF